MNKPATDFLLSQLAAQSPAALVYLAGAILSLVFIRRSTLAAVLCLVGCVILLLLTLALPVIQAGMLQNRIDSHTTADAYARASFVITVVGGIVRAFGVGSVIAAVFVGRQQEMPPLPPRWPATPPAL